jgi:ribose transport system ATP-binding protein
VAYVPQERRSEGLMMQMGSRANALLPHYRGWRARMSRERAQAEALAAQVGLKSAGPEQSVWRLSGGNQQKVVFARAIAGAPGLLLLDEPTRGVDVGAKFEIYKLMRALSAQGCAILLSSTDLPELLGMSDRILVLQAGRQTATLDPTGMAPSDLLQAFYAPSTLSEAS